MDQDLHGPATVHRERRPDHPRHPSQRLDAPSRLRTKRRPFGCPYGTLCSELVKRVGGVEPLAARLMQLLLGWIEQQFHFMGQRDAHNLAVEFVAAYQGSAVLTSALGHHGPPSTTIRKMDRRAHHVNGPLRNTTRRERLTQS